MAQTTVNFRMDEDLKRSMEKACSDMGLSMTTAFTIFAKTVVSQNKIPFEISAESDPFYSEVNQTRLIKAIADLNAGNGKFHKLIEVEDD
jgi:DNA-damage-inducible protein J